MRLGLALIRYLEVMNDSDILDVISQTAEAEYFFHVHRVYIEDYYEQLIQLDEQLMETYFY